MLNYVDGGCSYFESETTPVTEHFAKGWKVEV